MTWEELYPFLIPWNKTVRYLKTYKEKQISESQLISLSQYYKNPVFIPSINLLYISR